MVGGSKHTYHQAPAHMYILYILEAEQLVHKQFVHFFPSLIIKSNFKSVSR